MGSSNGQSFGQKNVVSRIVRNFLLFGTLSRFNITCILMNQIIMHTRVPPAWVDRPPSSCSPMPITQ